MTNEQGKKIISLAKRCGAYVYKDGDAVFDSTEDIEIFYHAAIATFLKESGQYVTNDASREACIKQAKAEAFEAAAVMLDTMESEWYDGDQFRPNLPGDCAAAIREMAKEIK